MKIPLTNLWSIEQSAADKLVAMMESGAAIESKQQTIAQPVGQIGLIHITGPMLKGSAEAYWYGGTSTVEATRAINEFASSDGMKSIVLNFDSPGGTVDGLAELGDAIFEARKKKKVYSQVSGTMASAAYYAASQADRIYAGRMDMIGSIGTRLMLYDFSQYFENLGIKAIPIDTGPMKSAGATGTEITAEQQAYFQDMVNGYFDDFVAMVSRGRGMPKADVRKVADGRMFMADDAVKNGLIDGIQTLDVTVSKLNGRYQSQRRAAALLRESELT